MANLATAILLTADAIANGSDRISTLHRHRRDMSSAANLAVRRFYARKLAEVIAMDMPRVVGGDVV